ncbi:hypothetical protein OG233_17900 [Streptomyces sp. NBC_01218]|uniref:hypothetical protein n=1 Tax=Streptomyces sp. NBC_01218 TaxID=2903780 RepID=UPI002E131850|nr:hypothetical protein OG233_17900 [Streptomyces sp. NBC_01218]
MGVALTGCANDRTHEGASDGATKEPSADRMLDEANAAMRALPWVTVESAGGGDGGGGTTMRLSTDLTSTCAFTTTSATGATFEQIRIDGTDYVSVNRTYLEEAGREPARADWTKRWVKTPAGAARPGDGLVDRTQPFASFGEVAKGGTTEVGGVPARELKVTDASDESGSYSFYVATEGKPYILKVVYEGGGRRTTTSYSDFDAPTDVRAPDAAEVVDTGALG